MNRDSFTNHLPVVITTLFLVRLFVLVVVLSVFFSSGLLLQTTTLANPEPLVVTLPELTTPGVSPVDAAIANSEWSGAQIIKTPVTEITPFIIPTRIPTDNSSTKHDK